MGEQSGVAGRRGKIRKALKQFRDMCNQLRLCFSPQLTQKESLNFFCKFSYPLRLTNRGPERERPKGREIQRPAESQ